MHIHTHNAPTQATCFEHCKQQFHMRTLHCSSTANLICRCAPACALLTQTYSMIFQIRGKSSFEISQVLPLTSVRGFTETQHQVPPGLPPSPHVRNGLPSRILSRSGRPRKMFTFSNITLTKTHTQSQCTDTFALNMHLHY